MELEKLNKHVIATDVVNRLFRKVTDDKNRFHPDVMSFSLVTSIIDEWFLEQGIDFWSQPEIERYEINGDDECTITFYTK